MLLVRSREEVCNQVILFHSPAEYVIAYSMAANEGKYGSSFAVTNLILYIDFMEEMNVL